MKIKKTNYSNQLDKANSSDEVATILANANEQNKANLLIQNKANAKLKLMVWVN
ncbi:hypothetical protein [Ureaplasma diversum]|uniref:Uncharacterized protein n=1 Tax=Ureaplasma diversum NCTC 246 TaxID=1188241 RepID=A0A084F0N8_9BACT|nr:hypothetical protein [Ureaplasma diversum]KEZ23780.1 hypothetical protein UDIV_2370 [Ureaplasma diversum NCTC 246]